MSNSLGTRFRITSFGESHGKAVGVVIDGCPAGLSIDTDFLQRELARRRPGQSAITTQRNETDNAEIISGIYEGISTGAPITILIYNNDQRPADYDAMKDIYRPGHADYTYQVKYGHRDHRGGGRSSARTTAGWVAAGTIARMVLKKLAPELSITGFVSAIHTLRMSKPYSFDKADIERSPVRCPQPTLARQMEALILETKQAGDSLGGIISCIIEHCPAGLGEPVFEKLHAALGKAMLSINAVKGVQFGDGFEAAAKKGSEMNDLFIHKEGTVKTDTNHSGGVQGGISNGMPIVFDVAFKPTSTIAQPQLTVDNKGNTSTMEAAGRHDPCVLPRAVPIVEALSAVVLTDMLLLSFSDNL